MPTAFCPVCGEIDVITATTVVGDRAYCPTCFHAWRTSIKPFSYTATAMCSLGTSDARLRAQIEFFSSFAPARPRILELGCATGELAAATREMLDPARYDAIELSPAADTALPYLDTLFRQPLGELLDTQVTVGPYDLVLLSHVLEHIENPNEEVAAIDRVLAPGGAVFIEVPNRSGHRRLPIDDNRSHLHFFTTSSIARLLANAGYEVRAVTSGSYLDPRYADSLRIVAQRFAVPGDNPTLLSGHPLLAGEDRIVVWGAGSLSDELLSNFFDPARIDFFIDKDPAKQGSMILGRPVRDVTALGTEPRTILLNSIDFAPAIAADIAERFPDHRHKLVAMADLLG